MNFACEACLHEVKETGELILKPCLMCLNTWCLHLTKNELIDQVCRRCRETTEFKLRQIEREHQEAKRLFRNAGFGVVGSSLVETTLLETVREVVAFIRDQESQLSNLLCHQNGK